MPPDVDGSANAAANPPDSGAGSGANTRTPVPDPGNRATAPTSDAGSGVPAHPSPSDDSDDTSPAAAADDVPAESSAPPGPAEARGEAEPPAPAATTEEPVAKKPASRGFLGRLRRGLGRTSDSLVAGLGNLFLGRKTIDDDLIEELESRLLMADVGIEATTEIIEHLTERVSRSELNDGEALLGALRSELEGILAPCEQPLHLPEKGPFVILIVGVNGVGKTTTIGKLARRFQDEGRSVMLAAGDTFRAAAVEQLQHWGARHDVPVIAQHTGADSASVIYDALQAATSRGTDVLIADTAGRLSNKSHLMEELAKVVRVLRKLNAEAPQEVMLILDAGTGQNALAQAEQFREAVGVTSITLTKLDGTAKGGVIFAIARRLGLPIRFIGVGESAEDLRPFVASDFIRALFDRD